MAKFCTFVLVLAAALGMEAASESAPSGESTADAANESQFPRRKPAEMRRAVSDALRATATAESRTQRDRAIRQLMLVLLELEQDQNLVQEERVSLHTQVRSRLVRLEKTLSAELSRSGKSADKRPRNASTKERRAAEQPPIAGAQNQAVLAQRIAPAGGNVGQPALQRAGGIGQPNGGVQVAPAVIGGGAFGQAQADDGEDLVQLIQTVIAPRTWNVNGGPSSIVYYRNLRALVVSAPSEVHSHVGDVLIQLRR